jgi:hypothetical protein
MRCIVIVTPKYFRGAPCAAGLEQDAAFVIIFTNTRHEASLVIRKLQSGEYRLYSRKVNPKTGKRRNLGTFKSRAAAEKHERDVQYFKRH